MSSEEDDVFGEQEQAYPPWLDPIVNPSNEEAAATFDRIKVEQEQPEDTTQPGYVRCKEVQVPDAADAAKAAAQLAAKGKADTAVKTYTLRRLTPVMIVSEPNDPPYIGLIDKIWRKEDAVPKEPGIYTASDFSLECYWFYRPREVPADAWKRLEREALSGANYKLSKRHRSTDEDCSERQLLFSSHHTCHDYPDDKGRLSMEGFLQTCTMHWVGLNEPPPERYAIHGGRLVRMREPGFLVQGFLWCGKKSEEQLNYTLKRVHALDGQWPDNTTMQIVAAMRRKYQDTHKKIQARNQAMIDKYMRHRAASKAGNVSDDGDLAKHRHAPGQGGTAAGAAAAAAAGQQQQRQQQQQQQKPRNPPSPRLPGVEDEEADQHDGRSRFLAPVGFGGGVAPTRPGAGAAAARSGPGAFGDSDDDD